MCSFQSECWQILCFSLFAFWQKKKKLHNCFSFFFIPQHFLFSLFVNKSNCNYCILVWQWGLKSGCRGVQWNVCRSVPLISCAKARASFLAAETSPSGAVYIVGLCVRRSTFPLSPHWHNSRDCVRATWQNHREMSDAVIWSIIPLLSLCVHFKT